MLVYKQAKKNSLYSSGETVINLLSGALRIRHEQKGVAYLSKAERESYFSFFRFLRARSLHASPSCKSIVLLKRLLDIPAYSKLNGISFFVAF